VVPMSMPTSAAALIEPAAPSATRGDTPVGAAAAPWG
jgi:hypothetical protein